MLLSRMSAAGALFVAAITVSEAAEAKPPAAMRHLTTAAEHFGERAQSAQSIKTVAAVTAPARNFVTEVRIDHEGRAYFRQTRPDGETLIAMHDGALSTEDADGAIVAASAGTIAFVMSHAFHWNVINAMTLFDEHGVGGATLFGGETTIPVTMTGHGGQPIILHLRESDMLPLGMTITPRGRDTPVQVFYRDWIEIDGAKAFSKAIIADDGDIYAYQFVHISFDALSPADFSLRP